MDYTETIVHTDKVLKSLYRELRDNISNLDIRLLSVGRVLGEVVVQYDSFVSYLYKTFQLILTEINGLSDSIKRDVIKVFEEYIINVECVVKGISLVFIDAIWHLEDILYALPKVTKKYILKMMERVMKIKMRREVV